MKSRPSALRDFTVDHRTWFLIAAALVIGTGAAGLAVLLLRAIAFATNHLLLPPHQPRDGWPGRINGTALDYAAGSGRQAG